MASKVGIANVGLIAIGATVITSFGQGNKSANTINVIYDELRRNMLTHPWNFATQRVELARSSTTPAYGFDYAYTLPSDYIQMISVHDNDEGVGTTFYREEQVGNQRVLLSDYENLYLRYVKDEEDPNLMPADFRYALSMAIARDISLPLGSSNTMYAAYVKIAIRALNKAKSSDAMASFPEQRNRGSWANVRGGLSRRGFNRI